MKYSFHYDSSIGGGANKPCEAAYLSEPQTKGEEVAAVPEVTVLVLYALISRAKIR